MQKRFLLGLALLALVILVFVCACRHEGPRIEADLQERAFSTLADLEGLDTNSNDFEARIDGRDLILSGSVPGEPARQRILDAANGIRGLRLVDDRLTLAGLAPTTKTAPGAASPAGTSSATEGDTADGFQPNPQTRLSISSQENGRWLLQGQVASAERRQSWLDAARTMFGADLVVDQLEIATSRAAAGDAENDPARSPDTLSPEAWIEALAAGPSDAGLHLGVRSVRAEGSVPDDPSAQRFLATIRRAAPEGWQIEDALKRTGATDATAVQDALAATLQIRNIEFETNSSSITPAGRQIVLRVAQALRSAPELAVEIEGHTDSSGNARWNQTLSQKRAEAVAHALQELGLDASRFTAQGFGSERPIADNSTREGRQANRRIEFKVLGGQSP